MQVGRPCKLAYACAASNRRLAGQARVAGTRREAQRPCASWLHCYAAYYNRRLAAPACSRGGWPCGAPAAAPQHREATGPVRPTAPTRRCSRRLSTALYLSCHTPRQPCPIGCLHHEHSPYLLQRVACAVGLATQDRHAAHVVGPIRCGHKSSKDSIELHPPFLVGYQGQGVHEPPCPA